MQLFVSGAYCEQPSELSGDWLQFVSDPRSKGTILLAFGTILNWQKAPPEKREAFVGALNQLTDYRIVWSYNGPKIDVAQHIKLARWVPQMELLYDTRTKLFLTHGGLKRLSILKLLFVSGAYCEQPGELSSDWLQFVSDPRSKGTILLAFGTILNWQKAPSEKREAFVGALNQLTDYRIVWSYNGPKIDVAQHIKLARWVPQMELLYDTRTRLFLTHGGLKSVKEAACASMPTIFMPMFAEQTRNSWLAWNRGYGKLLNKVNITAESLLHTIREMLENTKYKENALKFRRFYDDVSPISAIEGGAFWIERLLKYGGRMPNYFYTRSTQLSYTVYLNLDLIIFIPGVFVLLLLVR
ncbi:unnamed protein product [Gongylonema pulchrum]|uniref:UDP-glucuronosyltransferase n=1 Tax=Gongylonema pulchrum TaxID=637853 RepID=A0A3P7QQ67_9BILA|nr:unnamed protein product [Gongylonema pulchrum]